MENNKAFGILIIRLLLGSIFFMQGFGKVFTWGVNQMMRMDFFYKPYEKILPDYIIFGTAYYTSYIELFGGLLLIIGFKRDIALRFLGSVLVIVSIGHGIAEPIWDLSHVIFRAFLLVSLLMMPKDWDIYRVDNMIKNRKKIGF